MSRFVKVFIGIIVAVTIAFIGALIVFIVYNKNEMANDSIQNELYSMTSSITSDFLNNNVDGLNQKLNSADKNYELFIDNYKKFYADKIAPDINDLNDADKIKNTVFKSFGISTPKLDIDKSKTSGKATVTFFYFDPLEVKRNENIEQIEDVNSFVDKLKTVGATGKMEVVFEYSLMDGSWRLVNFDVLNELIKCCDVELEFGNNYSKIVDKIVWETSSKPNLYVNTPCIILSAYLLNGGAEFEQEYYYEVYYNDEKAYTSDRHTKEDNRLIAVYDLSCGEDESYEAQYKILPEGKYLIKMLDVDDNIITSATCDVINTSTSIFDDNKFHSQEMGVSIDFSDDWFAVFECEDVDPKTHEVMTYDVKAILKDEDDYQNIMCTQSHNMSNCSESNIEKYYEMMQENIKSYCDENDDMSAENFEIKTVNIGNKKKKALFFSYYEGNDKVNACDICFMNELHSLNIRISTIGSCEELLEMIKSI